MNKTMHTAHQFALWTTLSIQNNLVGNIFSITDTTLVNRITAVLRLKIGETFILFDSMAHSYVSIIAIDRKKITVQTLMVIKNSPQTPTITVLLPTLKKDDLSTAIHNLTACGVSTIQLISTQGG